ncbi:MAG: DegT/DnrJ/EryC1/StrS family aminotransferase [Candidatus Latescibacterota bacterium]|nr:MAG: DegT/DnrJ/EryC1/StrS family aminotransferase [Candidatus Latescibacterota bacterium]
MSANTPALEGGTPVRTGEPVPFFRAALTDADVAAVVDTLRSGWLTLGPRTAQFEAECAAFVEAPHAVATSSCTAALFLALRALGIGEGDEVIVPSLTFPATVNTIRHVGAEPVLADVELASFGLDPGEVPPLVTPRTRAIVCVDYAGQPCRLTELREIARSNDLYLIEDAAHAFGAALEGRPVGSWAHATAFSFYATKCITTGEGGLLTCNDEELAQRARLLGFHGMQRDSWKRYSDRGSWAYEVECAGYKFNMNDVQAALGLSQLKRAHALRESRTRVAEAYSHAFRQMRALRVPERRPNTRHAWHLYVVQLQLEQLRVGRDRFTRALREEGVVPSVHFIPYHRQPAGRELTLRRALAHTEAFADRCISLPLFPQMPERDVEDVIEAVAKLLRHYSR